MGNHVLELKPQLLCTPSAQARALDQGSSTSSSPGESQSTGRWTPEPLVLPLGLLHTPKHTFSQAERSLSQEKHLPLHDCFLPLTTHGVKAEHLYIFLKTY